MQMYETALGRLVSVHEFQTVLEDSILRLLFDYRMHPQNPNNVPMKLEDIVHAVSSSEAEVKASLDALMEQAPPLVENIFKNSKSFRITGTGVRFVRNQPQGLASLL
jgi:hypothetical protein